MYTDDKEITGGKLDEKASSRFSLMRVEADPKKCVSCGKCRKVCPMNVAPDQPFAMRANRTECILCMKCAENCPKGALALTMKSHAAD